MKRIICILLGIGFVFPALCYSCPLCSPIVFGGSMPNAFYRHINQSCGYYYWDVGTPFQERMDTVIAHWKSYASISMNSGGSEWCITWEYDNTPTNRCAETSVTVDFSTGDLSSITTTFKDTILNTPWEWTNTCDGVPPAYNLSKAMMHEAGHALGLCLPCPLTGLQEWHPTSGSVMQQGGCYTALVKETDGACAAFLYPVNGISRCETFTPVFRRGGVAINWQTEYEYETSHFMLEKKQSNGSFATIAEPIMSAGSAHAGANYEYFDPAGTRSDTYRLMEVDNSGIVLGTAEERVLLSEPSAKLPIVLSEAERMGLQKDVAAMLERQKSGKDNVLKAPMSGETT